MRILYWSSDVCSSDLLTAAMKAHAPDARLIMASTSHVYDADSPRPGAEEDRCSPTLDYPASKLAAETELRDSGLNWSNQRFGFAYGDGDGHIESLPRHLVQVKLHPAQRMSMEIGRAHV